MEGTDEGEGQIKNDFKLLSLAAQGSDRNVVRGHTATLNEKCSVSKCGTLDDGGRLSGNLLVGCVHEYDILVSF